MSSSPLRRENKSRRDNGTRAILRERSEFHRPTIASSAKRVPREENASLQLVPDYYPQIPGLKLTNIRAPQVRTLVHIMCDRYGDVRLEDKMEVIGDMNVRQHEMRSLKPIMKETVIAQNHRIWQPETKLDVHVARNFLCVKRVTKVRANDAPKGLRYEERKVFQSTSMHSGDRCVDSQRKYIFDILRSLEIRVELVVLNGYKRKCRIVETVEVRADKSNAVANHELIPLIRPTSKACNKKRVLAPLSCNETFNVGSNVIRMQRQIEIEDQQNVIPFTWSRVNKYDMKNIRREYSGHPAHLCADRISHAELLSQPLSQQLCGELTARSPSVVTAILKRSFCDRLVSNSSVKTARSSTSVNNSGLTDTSAGGGSESASSGEISPSVIHRESFKADETRRGNASLYDKQTPTASLQIQQAATSMSTTEKPRQIRRTTANKDENIVIQAVDKHGFWTHLELEMCIKIENKENENMQLLRTATNRISIGERTIFET